MLTLLRVRPIGIVTYAEFRIMPTNSVHAAADTAFDRPLIDISSA